MAEELSLAMQPYPLSPSVSSAGISRTMKAVRFAAAAIPLPTSPIALSMGTVARPLEGRFLAGRRLPALSSVALAATMEAKEAPSFAAFSPLQFFPSAPLIATHPEAMAEESVATNPPPSSPIVFSTPTTEDVAQSIARTHHRTSPTALL